MFAVGLNVKETAVFKNPENLRGVKELHDTRVRLCAGQMHKTLSVKQFFMPGIVLSQGMGDTHRVHPVGRESHAWVLTYGGWRI